MTIEQEAYEAWCREAREHVGDTLRWEHVPEGVRRAWTVALEHGFGLLEKVNPIPMLLWCPQCGERHIDARAFATKPHHTHACQHCGHCWRPAVVPTCGVKFLPGFKNTDEIPF